jgi:7-cyano-7-deazaguanine synthase
MKLTVVPNRNAIFASMVYGYALSVAKKYNTKVSIGLGIHSGDHAIYPDCTPQWLDKIYAAFKAGNWDGELVSTYVPYIQEDKFFILKDTIESCKITDTDFDTVLANTNTCYAPDSEGKSCGKCGSCTERLEAFEVLNRLDPVPYK